MNETGNALTETELAVQYYAKLALAQARAGLARVRQEAQEWRDEVQSLWLDPAEGEELQRKLTAMKENRNFWWKRAYELSGGDSDAENKRNAALQSTRETQAHWLSPCEVEGLQRQLAKAQIQAATPKEAVLRLWRFYDWHTLIARPGHEDDIREAWDKLLIAVDSIAGDALLERLTILDTAEAALADCGIGGIHAEFGGLPDAIEQMAQHIKELMQEPVEVEMTDAEMGEALRTEVRKRVTVEADAHTLSKALDECMQTVHAERRLRREAEQEHGWWCKEAQEGEERHTQTRVKLAEMERYAERAEGLAAVVTPELAELLENMASCCREYADVREPADKLHPSRGYVMAYRRFAKEARSLAAEIRRTLDDNQA